MIAKIDVLMPSQSQYQVLQHFTQKFYEALSRTGISCRLLQGEDCINAPLHSPPDCTIGFNGAILMVDDTLLCDHLKIPHVACLVDPSFRFFSLMHSPYIIMACDDRFSTQLLLERGFKNALFMPHAVERDLSPIPDQKRIYEVAMLATITDCEKRRLSWSAQFPAKIQQRMEKAIALALSDDTTSFMTILSQVFHDLPIEPSTEQNAFQEIELYIKGRDRLDLIQAVKDHPVHLFGNIPADSAFIKQSNVVIHPQVSYTEALEIIQQSKVLLNSSLKNTYGGHERIFSAAACEAVVVTNDNLFLRQHLVDKQDLILYRRSHFKEMNTTLNTILKDENKRQKMALNGRHKVMAHHTWDHRVKKLLADISPIINNMR